MKTEKQNALTILLFAIYLSLLVGVVLFKLPFRPAGIGDEIRMINWIPFQGSELREVFQNIVIFAPFGVYLCMLKDEWLFMRKALLIFTLSFTFEAIQFIFAMGRTDITDILSNTLGGIIGIFVYVLLFRIFKTRTNQIVNILALAITVCAMLRFGHLFYLSHFVMRRMP